MFSPTPKEVERAERILVALKEAEAQGKGAASLDGKMIDAASEKMAKNLLVTSAAIKAADAAHKQIRHAGNARLIPRRSKTWTFTSTRPRSFSRSSACRSRAAASPTAPSRRPTAPARSAAPWVVKAQIHSGARGKAGGVKVCKNEQEIADAAEFLLGRKLVTHQTGPAGKLVSRLYIEEATNIDQEIYLGFVMDRASERIVVVASAAGGMEIEEISASQPDTIIRVSVDPAVGMQQFQAREIAFGLGVDPEIVNKLVPAIMGCYRAFRDLDATMVEINPLVITKEKQVVALDAKMSFDDNALFRRPHIAELRDKSQEDPRETYASDRGLAYVGLDGDIGCIVNGAGLAMATLDMIKLAGGEPANFLDIGGGASPERVTKSFKAVLRDKNVKAILRQRLRRHQPLRLGREGCRRRRQGTRNYDADRRSPRRHERRRRTQDHRQ